MSIKTHSPADSAAWAPIMGDVGALQARETGDGHIPVVTPTDPFSPRVRRWQARINSALSPIATASGLCAARTTPKASVKLAELFFVNCPCCLFWRGVAVGAIGGALAVGLLAIGVAWVA